MSTHTPGPWYPCQWGHQIDIGTYPSGQGMIARVAPDRDRQMGIPDPQDTANARLIAAAPVMLAALESARDELEVWSISTSNGEKDEDTERALAEVNAAIATARGEETP